MKLRFEVELDSRYVTVDVGRKAAELYGRYAESESDDVLDELMEEVMEDLKDRINLIVMDAEIGR